MEHGILSLIAAVQTPDYGVGMENKLLCMLGEDLKRFKALTSGHPVIMGWNTWDSLPPKWRPLPNRTNIVMTRNGDRFVSVCDAGGMAAASFDQALEIAMASDGGDHIFAIGGASIWKEASTKADQIYLTEFAGTNPADAFFPKEILEMFESRTREEFVDEKNGTHFSISLLSRKKT